MGVLHPAVVEVAAAAGEFLYELPHAPPRAVAKPFGLGAVVGDKHLTYAHFARVLDGVLIQLHEVFVDRPAYDRDPDVHS